MNETEIISGDILPLGAARESGYMVYWGDLHCHTNISKDFGPLDNYGVGGPYDFFSPACYFSAAMQRGLNFAAITDHSEDIISDATGTKWAETVSAALGAERSNFVPLLGYEVCAQKIEPNGPEDYRAMNVIFRDIDNHQVFGHRTQPHRNDQDGSFLEFGEILASLSPTQLVAQMCVRRDTQNFGFALSQEEKAYIRNCEIISTSGGVGDVANGTAQARLNLNNLRVGFCGVSNCHAEAEDSSHVRVDWSPGAGRGALTGLLLKNLSRDSVFEALQARRLYAVTNCWPGKGDGDERIKLDFTVNGHMMGEEFSELVAPSGSLDITVSVHAQKDNRPIQRAEIWKHTISGGSTRIWSQLSPGLGTDDFDGEFTESIQKGETAAYWTQIYLRNDGFPSPFATIPGAWSSPIWVSAN